MVMIGYGTMSLLTSTASMAMTQGLQLVGSIGLGVLQVGPMFAVLAPLSVSDNANALALCAYVRTLGQYVKIGATNTIAPNYESHQVVWDHYWDYCASKWIEI